jgi:hypothetical protein
MKLLDKPEGEIAKEPKKANKASKYFGFANCRMNCMIKVFEQDGQILLKIFNSHLPAMTIDEFDEFLCAGCKALEEAEEMKSLIGGNNNASS